MKAGFAIALLAVAMLCISAVAQENTAGYWLKKGYELSANGSNEQALQAYEKVISIDPENSLAWINKANALARLNKTSESNQAYHKALEITDKMLKADPRNATLCLGKGILLNNVGNIEEAVKAFDNASKIDPKNEMAWMMMGVLLASDLHRYDDAVKAFDSALQIDPKDAQVWGLKGDALKALDRQAEADAAYAKAKELGFEVSTKSQTKGSSTPVRMLAITAITSAGKNKSVEITNSRTKAQSFKGWTLNIDDGMNQSAALPDFTLGPDKKVNIHFSKGVSNGTDLFLNSAVNLNDTAGNITLKNETGKTAASFGYRVEPDGSVTGIMVAKGEFSYPQSGSNDVKMVVREAGNGPYVTERTEYKTEATQSMAPAVAQANTADYWYRKGIGLMGNGSYEEATMAMQKAVELDSTNATLWDAKASSLAVAATFSGNRSQYNESLKAQDKAIELDPKNSTLLVHKGFLIASLADLSGHKSESMYEDAIKEFDKAIKLDPQDKDAWNWKGMVLDSRLNRYDEALAAYDKAIEIGGTNASDKILLSRAWEGKGYDMAKLGKYNESFKAYDKAIDLNPQNAASIWYVNATAVNASGMYGEAIKAYDKAIELSKENVTAARAYEDKGMTLFKLGKYDEAVKAYDKAIGLYPMEPMSGRTWYKKGIALKALGKNSEADAAFAKAKELGYRT